MNLNKRIAELKGICLHKPRTEKGKPYSMLCEYGEHLINPNPDWQNNIADAWELWNEMPIPKKLIEYCNGINEKPYHHFVAYCDSHPNKKTYPYGYRISSGNSETAPEAICKAWIAYMEKK